MRIRTLSLLASYAFSLSSTQKWSAQPRVRVLYNSACQLADRIRSDTVEWTRVTGGQTDRIIHGGRYTALACIMRLSRAIKMCQAAVEFSVDLSLVQRLRAENSLLLQRIEQLEKVSRCTVSGFTEWIFGFTQSLYRPNFITSIVCGFVVQLVIQQIHNKSERSPQQVRNKSNACSKSATSSLQIHNSSTNPQRVYNMSTTNPQQIEVVEFGP